MTHLCSKLYRDFNHEGWNEFDLEELPLRELQFLCRMLGLPHSGTRAVVIVRLLSCRIVRLELSKFPDDVEPVVESFTRSRLHWMCCQAKLWKSGNKRGLARVLLMWRNECRDKGQKFLNACIEHTKQSGEQLILGI